MDTNTNTNPTRPLPTSVARTRSARWIALAVLVALLGLSSCGTSGESNFGAPKPPPPVDGGSSDDGSDDYTDEDSGGDEDSEDEVDPDAAVYPDDARSVPLAELIDLCELYPLEMAQELVPTLAAPGVDPSSPHVPVDYWCDWVNPTPAHPEDTDSFDPPLRAASLIDEQPSYWTDREYPLEGEPPTIEDLDVEGASYYFGYTSDGGLAIYVQVLSSDQSKFVGFYFGGGESICEAPYESGDCTVDPGWDNDEVREILVEQADELAAEVQPLLDDHEF